MRFPALVLLPIYCLLTSPITAATTFFGPLTSYSSSDSVPSAFFCQECDDCVHVIEDFEDNSLDHGLTIESTDGQIIGPGFGTGLEGLTDSVDGDDGAVDGVGNEAHSYFSSGNVLTINFPSPMKSAGFVWTDGDRGTMTTVDFYGHDGLLGSLGPFALADDSFQGTTAEDTFFAAKDPDGITSIVVTNLGGSGIEIDHVQFEDCSACTATVPEPNGLLLLLFGGLGAFGFRRN